MSLQRTWNTAREDVQEKAGPIIAGKRPAYRLFWRAMASARSSARAVPAAPSPAIMMVWSAKDFPVSGCAAKIPASTTAAVPCEAERAHFSIYS